MAAKKAKSKKTAEKKNRTSSKDVIIAYLMNGVGAVERLYNDGHAARHTLRKALEELTASGRSVEPFNRWMDENLGAKGSGRGRSAPGSGDTRTYKAQAIKGSSPFLRLPLEVLGAKKGTEIKVRFERDEIIVTR
jgi:hypothetical protein